MLAIDALPSVLGAAAVVPPFFYLLSLTLVDNRPEPPFVVVGSFVLGGLGIAVLQVAHPSLGPTLARAVGELAATFSEAFADVAVPEELVKTLVLVAFCRPFIANRHPIEGVVYGAAVGLGFAAAENLLLVAYRPWDWSAQFVLRSLLTVPLHGALGVIAGVYICRAHFAPLQPGWHGIGHRLWMYAIAWAFPVVLHGSYDFPLLLALDRVDAHDPITRALRTVGAMIALAVIMKAAQMTYRTAEAQYARPGPYGAGTRGDSQYWRQHVIGGVAGLVGALMVLIEIRDWWLGAPFLIDRHIFMLIGAAITAIGALHHHRAAQRRHASPAATGSRGHAAHARRRL